MKRLAVWSLLVIAGVVLLPPLTGLLPAQSRWKQAAPQSGERVAIGQDQFLHVLPCEGCSTVLVHGLPGGIAQLQPLAEALRGLGEPALVYDRAGWGLSSRRADTVPTLASNAQDLIALLDARQLRAVDLVGFSFGGGVAQTVAMLAPGRVRSLVLVSSIAPRRQAQSRGLMERLVLNEGVMRWSLSSRALARGLMDDAFVSLFHPEPVPESHVTAQLATMTQGQSIATWLVEGSVAEAGVAPEGIRAPVLVLHGADDAIVPVDVGRELASRIPRAQLVVLPATGHGMVLTHAAALARHIRDFHLRARGASPATR
ncbi:MAG: alpha/beta hydrolase [Pseudomonadales bacterium]|nr:alpha/beta hydrolase [Pseudomonadales bacterium]